MPPHKNQPVKPASATKKKAKGNADDSEEFQSLLSELTKVTRTVGKEQIKDRAKEETLKKKNAEKHVAVVKKQNTSDMEQFLERQAQQKQLQALFQQMMMANRPFLSAPNTEFASETVTLPGKFEVGIGSMQGWRSSMEDTHIADVKTIGNADCGIFSVFDGHAGVQCAKRCKVILPALMRKHLNEANNTVDFLTAYHELDASLRPHIEDGSGCTACTVLVTPTSVTCANVGDSRAVLCRGSGAIDLSQDHKPDDESEKVRIEAAGGHVENNRVNGQLAMSRAIGDYSYKQQENRGVDEQLVIPLADVVTKERTAEDRFVVVACDGIFDVLSNQELVDLINEEMKKDPQQPLTKICETICNVCLAPASPGGGGQPARPAGTDNMTIVLVKLL